MVQNRARATFLSCLSAAFCAAGCVTPALQNPAAAPPPLGVPSPAAAPMAPPAPSTATAAISVSTPNALPLPPSPPPPPPLKLLATDEWPALKDELDKRSLLKAAGKTLAYLETLKDDRKFYKIGNREVAAGLLASTARELVKAAKESRDDQELAERLKRDFDLYESIGSDGAGKVVFSAYYQPALPASPRKTKKYKYPIYRKPPDMVDVELGLFNPKWKGESVLGRVRKNGKVTPYFDRRDIDTRGALQGRKLEVAWLANQFDRLDLHIQGSGILEFPDGRKVLAKYAATNALPYKSVGLSVVGAGAMSRNEITHEKLRQYLTEHPEGESWLIAQDPRYTFFDLAPLPEDGEPFGTIQQSLTPGRSIAVDPKIIPLGATAYFRTSMPQADRAGDLFGIFQTSRFAFCQDTGGAIQGPGRVDIYVGHGPQAKTSAVNQWADGKLYILLRKLPERDR